jgi:hypothetical protein
MSKTTDKNELKSLVRELKQLRAVARDKSLSAHRCCRCCRCCRCWR